MEIAAVLLAGGAVFFAGFCLGFFMPAKPGAVKRPAVLSAERNEFFENFLSYDGQVRP